MTTYTFVPNPSRDFVNWDDPTVWAGMAVPDAGDADVVFPLAITPSSGVAYTSYVTIKNSESFVARSVADNDGNLELEGSLSVSGAVSLGANAEIDLSGGQLSFGSLTDAGFGIQGSGQVTTPGTLTNTQQIIGAGLTVTVGSLLNPGSLIATGLLTVTLTGGNAGSDFAGGVLTGGVYQVAPGGMLVLNTGAPITAIGATVEVAGSATPSGSGDIESNNPATGSTLPLQQTLQTVLPSGDLAIQGNGYTVSQDLTDEGAISLEAGTLSTPGLTVTASGRVSGNGTVAGPVQNNGLIEAGITAAGTGANQTLVLSGAVTGTGALVIAPAVGSAQSTLVLAGPDSENVSFGDGTGSLVLDDAAAFTGSIAVAPTTVAHNTGTATGYRSATSFFDDTVILAGTAFGSVSGTSFAPTATGGTLTIQEGAAQQALTFVGSNLTAASFALSAEPQALSTSPPSLSITVTPAPTIPTLTVAGGGTAAIVNTATPGVAGTTSPDATVALSADGVAEGTGAITYPDGTSATASYAATLSPGLGLGFHQVFAAASNGAGTTTSAPLDLDVLPAPVAGVTAIAATSLDAARLLGQGYGFAFVSGTEALQLTNGTLSVGPDTTQALVQRFYEGLLGRPGDTFGLAGFNATLVGGGSPAAVATSILTSSEYGALHGPPDAQTDTQFVTGLYGSFLDRAPDQPGLAGWVNDLAAGASRGQVAAGFAASAEAKSDLGNTTAHVWVPNPEGALVTEFYETGLGRAPDLAGLQGWEQQLNAGLTPLGLSQGIATSAEFNADHAGSSNAAFVTSLYGAGLGRTPGAGELQGWVGQLQAGAGSVNVLDGIATSAEAGFHLLPPI